MSRWWRAPRWRQDVAVVVGVALLGVILSLAITDVPVLWALAWLAFGVGATVVLSFLAWQRDHARWRTPGVHAPELRNALGRARGCVVGLEQAVGQWRDPVVAGLAPRLLADVDEVFDLLGVFCLRVDAEKTLLGLSPSGEASPGGPGHPGDGQQDVRWVRTEYVVQRLPRLIDGAVADLELALRSLRQNQEVALSDVVLLIGDRLREMQVACDRLEALETARRR